MSNKGGRPAKYNNKEELQNKIDNYFNQCKAENRPYTVTGLALALDLDRKALINYSKNEEFSNTIKKAKAIVENYLEEHLISGQGNSSGIIFNLKNNYGWKDKQENINIETNYEQYLKKVEGHEY